MVTHLWIGVGRLNPEAERWDRWSMGNLCAVSLILL